MHPSYDEEDKYAPQHVKRYYPFQFAWNKFT